jgi:cytoskeletal protein CcmA (bactofilin family)
MAEWANGTGAQPAVPMDSNGQKLKVRNTSGAYSPSDYQADIADTSANAKALRVDGKIQLESGGTACGTIEPTSGQINILNAGGNAVITVSNNSTIVAGATVNIGAVGSDVVLQAPTSINGTPQGVHALHVQGDAAVDQRIWTPRIEVLNSDLALHLGTEQTYEVDIGTPPSQQYPNNVTRVLSKLTVNGHVETVADALIGTDLTANGDIESTGGQLIATGLDINGSGDVLGGLTVHGVVNAGILLGSVLDINGNGDVSGDLAVHGTVNGSVVQGSSLDINGNGDVSGTLSAGTVSAGGITASGTVFGSGGIECPNAAKFTPGAGTIDVKTVAQQSVNNLATLTVKHNSAQATMPALDVQTSSPTTAALRATSAFALEAIGDAKITGKTTHGNAVYMEGHEIRLGGTGATETLARHLNNRIEFWVGGRVRFYIDTTGGHNA